jgi:hypothetical protein
MIQVTSITHGHEIVTGSISNLTGNVFDKITTIIQFHSQKLVDATIDNQIVLAVDGFGSLDYITMLNGGNDFADFQIGDPIVIVGGVNAGTYSIISKPDDSTIQVNGILAPETTGSILIYVNYVQNAVEFSYGLVENAEVQNYLSKVDGTTQIFKNDFVNSVYAPMQNVGSSNGWFLGSCQIKTRTTPYSWQFGFEITHVHYVNPFFLFTQNTSTPPNYFLDDNSLRYVFKLKTKPFASFTSGINEGEFSPFDGNTGWFNERLNNNPTFYSISNLTYTKVSDLSSVNGVILTDTDETRVKFSINNTTNTPFSNGNTKFVVHIINVPFEQSDYQNTVTDLGENFTYDRALQTVGGGLVNGEFSRCVNGVTGTFISSSQVEIQFDVQFLLSDKNRIFGYDTRKFLIAVSVADHTKPLSLTDVTTLLVDYNDYGIVLGTDNVVTSTLWDLYDHPFYVNQTQVSSKDVFLEDEVFSNQRIKIDTSLSVYTPSLTSFEVGVQLRNINTGVIVKLDSVNIDVSTSTIVNGLQFVDLEVQRGFQLESSDILKRVKIKRNLALDVPNMWFYDVEFPFLVGWESWQINSLIPIDFFDVLEPNNGLNSSWERFRLNIDYQVEVFTNVVVKFNGTDYLYNLKNSIVAYDYDSNTLEWGSKFIKSYNVANTEVTNNILGFEKTKIVAKIDWLTGTAPTLSEVDWVLRLEPKNNGGRYISTRLSSVYPMVNNTQWESIDLSDMVVKTIIGNTFYAEAIINNDLLQDFDQFDITARIYHKTVVSDCAVDNLLAENGDCFIAENGDNLIQE